MTQAVKLRLQATGGAALVLSHLSLLTTQTFQRFRLREPSLSTGILQGKRAPSPMNTVVVSTMQTSRNLKHIEKLNSTLMRKIDLIVVDEAHHFPTASYSKIREFFPAAKVLGFTATPYKDRRVMTACFDSIAYSISLQELIDMGHLVPPKLNQIVRQGNSLEDITATVAHIYKTVEAGQKAIVFMRTIEDAKLCRNALESVGVRARAVTSEVTGETRNEILAAFDSGDTDVLTTVDVLTAGFDAPCTSAIFMPYGTKSPTQYLQRIGRGLRPFPGKSECRIYLWGDAPSVANGHYERQQFDVLNAGASAEKEFQRITDEAAYKLQSEGSEVYNWNQSVLETLARMKKLGMINVAELLDTRRFPKRFLQSIAELLKRLPDQKPYMKDGKLKATDAQADALFRMGFTSDAVKLFTKSEASMMIGAVVGQRSNHLHDGTKYVITEGTYKGKAVWETPHAYREKVKKRFPDSQVAQQIIQWEQRRA